MDRRSFIAGLASAAMAVAHVGAAHASAFNPLSFGATAGTLTGDPARDLQLAENNRRAFQQCADAFRDAVRAGDRGAVFVFPRGTYLVCAAPYAGANYINPTKLPQGWSRHAIVFDAGVLTGTAIAGGRIMGEGCRIVRIENDPFATDTAADSANSTILVMGRWSGLRVTGSIELEGYQVDSLSESKRGATSGDGWQFSFGVRDFFAEHLHGNKGTNAAFAINCNRRRITPDGSGRTGFEMREEWLCRRFEIERVTAINGEHGGLVNSASEVHIGAMTVTQEPYTYGGRPQRPYQQRGLYLLNAHRFTAGTLDLDGVHRVALFLAIFGAHRTASDLDVAIDRVSIAAPRGQDGDPDSYAGLQIQNCNEPGSPARFADIRIGRLVARGVRTGLDWRDRAKDGQELVAEDNPILRTLDIGSLDIEATVQGITIKPMAGANRIALRGGTVKVISDARYSSAIPVSGISIEAVTRTRRSRALGKTRSRVELEEAAKGECRPGAVAAVTDTPDGRELLICDPAAREGESRWRPMREPAPIAQCEIALTSVESTRATARFAGIGELTISGTTFARRGKPATTDEPVVAIEDCAARRTNFREVSGH